MTPRDKADRACVDPVRFRAAMVRAGYPNDYQLSKAINASPTRIGRWQKGEAMRLENLLKVCDVFGVTPEWLLGIDDDAKFAERVLRYVGTIFGKREARILAAIARMGAESRTTLLDKIELWLEAVGITLPPNTNGGSHDSENGSHDSE